jgi:hypothetical protein
MLLNKPFQTNGMTGESHPWRPRSKLDDPDALNPRKKSKSWSQSDDQNERNSQLRISDNVSTDDEKEFDEEDDINFESLCPLTCLPTVCLPSYVY